MPRTIRPIRIEGNVAYVTLTQGLEAVIDAVDVPLIEGRNWCAARHSGGRIYACGCTPKINGRNKTLYMHGVLTGFVLTDHIDGNGLHNRRENLREATNKQNQCNSRKQVNNTSGFKGVTWNKKSNLWQAGIMVDQKSIHLGLHATPEAAHAAYCEASARLHGEFGRIE